MLDCLGVWKTSYPKQRIHFHFIALADYNFVFLSTSSMRLPLTPYFPEKLQINERLVCPLLQKVPAPYQSLISQITR